MIYTLIRKKDGVNVDAVISFDSVSASSEAHTANVSTQTVESGFNITDNISIEPASYDLEAVISSYSLFSLDKEIVWGGEAFESEASPDDKAHTRARDEIIRIFKEGSILTLVESSANSNNSNYNSRYEELKSRHFKEIDNCVMTSLSISHPSDGIGAFYVSIKLQKIHIAVVTTVELTKAEMSPALKGLEIKDKTEASSTSTSTDGSSIDAAQQDGDSPSDTAKLEAEANAASRANDAKTGRTQADFKREEAKVIGRIMSKQAAYRQAIKDSAATRRKYGVFEVAGGWVSRPMA